MNLTPEQQAILNGEKGEVLAKVMKTLVMYGDASPDLEGCDLCGQHTDQQLGEGCGQVHAAGGHPDREE